MTTTNRPISRQVTTRWVPGEGSRRGHLHKLELEVVLEGVGGDEAQFARCDGAGGKKEEQNKAKFMWIKRNK